MALSELQGRGTTCEDSPMRVRIQRWPGASAGSSPRVLALTVLAFLGTASPSPAQLEPEAFTILKVALNENPPSPADAVRMLVKYKDPGAQANLRETWLKSLARGAAGKAADRRNKME